MSVKEKVGLESRVFEDRIDSEKVSRFAAATRWKGTGIPTTFLTVFREGERELFARLGFPLSKVLHAEQEFEFASYLPLDSEIEYQCRFTDCTEKKGSSVNLRFMRFTTEFRPRDGGEPFAFARMMIVVKDWDPA